jgi:hypothetical protein
MTGAEAKAEIFLLALKSLSDEERAAVLSALIQDPEMQEELVELILNEQESETRHHPFEAYVYERVIEAK